VRRRPTPSHDDAIVFRDQVFDRESNVGESRAQSDDVRAECRGTASPVGTFVVLGDELIEQFESSRVDAVQSHFNREFRTVMGEAPRRFFGNEDYR